MKLIAWNAVLTALLVVLALAGFDAYLHGTIPPMQEGTLYEYTLQSKRYKLMKPNVNVRIFGADVRTNDLGFRDNRAHVPAKRPDEFRIIVLGDSFTFGPGIAYERLYASLLQSRLRTSHPEVSVINLAVEGYNLLQYQAVLEEVGLALQPDMVLVGMFPVNDFELESYDQHRRIAAGEVPQPSWIESVYVYRAYLYRAEDLTIKALHRLLPAQPAHAADPGWEKNIGALKKIAEMAQARHLPLSVVLLPHTKGFETQRTIFARVNAYCRLEHLECLDLLEVFRTGGVRDGSLILNAVDSHPNETYHRLIARQLAPYVAAKLSHSPTGSSL